MERPVLTRYNSFYQLIEQTGCTFSSLDLESKLEKNISRQLSDMSKDKRKTCDKRPLSSHDDTDTDHSQGSPEMGERRKQKKKPRHACFKTYTITKWVFYLAWTAALGYTLFNISKSLNKFLSKPVSTKINVYHNENGTMQFPTISLCNLNKVNESFLQANDKLNKVWQTVIQRADPSMLDWSDNETVQVGDLLYQDVTRRGPSWDDTLLFCAYAGVRRCQDLPIFEDPSNMVEEELSPTGKCYRFNPKGLLHSKAGDYGSVYLRLNINLREYADKGSNGFVMAVHHHTQYSSTRNTGIVMSPGFKYRVNIKTLERSELPIAEGGKCNPKLQTNSYGAYDLESCHTECRDKELNEACGCIPVLPPFNTHNYRACTLREMIECGNSAYVNFVLEESDTGSARNHSCGCWVPCRHYSYELSTATTAISREYAEKKASGAEGDRLNFTTDDVLNNNIILEAYFRDMYVQEISQIPEYNFWNLLADVGGMLGLFLGASIFTIIDFFRYAINYGYKELYIARFKDPKAKRARLKTSRSSPAKRRRGRNKHTNGDKQNNKLTSSLSDPEEGGKESGEEGPGDAALPPCQGEQTRVDMSMV